MLPNQHVEPGRTPETLAAPPGAHCKPAERLRPRPVVLRQKRSAPPSEGDQHHAQKQRTHAELRSCLPDDIESHQHRTRTRPSRPAP